MKTNQSINLSHFCRSGDKSDKQGVVRQWRRHDLHWQVEVVAAARSAVEARAGVDVNSTRILPLGRDGILVPSHANHLLLKSLVGSLSIKNMVATGCPRIGLLAAAPGKARHRSACTLLLVVQTTVLIEIFRLPGGAAATAHPHSDHVSAAFDLDVQGVHYQSAASSVNLRNDTLQARVAILDAMVSTHSDRLARVQAAAGDSTATAAVSASLAAVEANTSSAAAWVALADAHALSGYVSYH